MCRILLKALFYFCIEIILILSIVLFAALFVMSIETLWLAFVFFLLAVAAVVFAFGIFPRYALRKLQEED